MPVGITESDHWKAKELLNESALSYLGQRIAYAIACERERIARMVENADNSMMDQLKLAKYIRGTSNI